jgi:UDPglucose 6-dehydrogenase
VAKIARAVGREHTDGLAGIVVGALGLTFKAGTDDLRESPSLAVIERLRELGADVRAYDPTTAGELDRVQGARLADIQLVDGPLAAASGADVLVVLTEWPEFASVDLVEIAAAMRGDALVDTRNLLDRDAVRAAGLRYDGVGRS